MKIARTIRWTPRVLMVVYCLMCIGCAASTHQSANPRAVEMSAVDESKNDAPTQHKEVRVPQDTYYSIVLSTGGLGAKDMLAAHFKLWNLSIPRGSIEVDVASGQFLQLNFPNGLKVDSKSAKIEMSWISTMPFAWGTTSSAIVHFEE